MILTGAVLSEILSEAVAQERLRLYPRAASARTAVVEAPEDDVSVACSDRTGDRVVAPRQEPLSAPLHHVQATGDRRFKMNKQAGSKKSSAKKKSSVNKKSSKTSGKSSARTAKQSA